MNVTLTYRKRVITQDDLLFIRQVINDYQSEGRSAISRRLCEAWDWRQVNGHLKDGVCRGLLLHLERNQLVTLPPRIIDNNNNAKRRRKTQATFDFHPTPLNATLADLAPIELRQVRRTPEEKLFNALVREHHYLGYSRLVGEHLKYLVYAGDRLLACFAFSSAPYAIDCRDNFLGWSLEARERNRHLLAYNSRFLILPAKPTRGSHQAWVANLAKASFRSLIGSLSPDYPSSGRSKEFLRAPLLSPTYSLLSRVMAGLSPASS